MEFIVVITLVFFAVFLANFIKKSVGKNQNEKKKIDQNKIDDFMLELREYPPEIEFQTLLEYVKIEDDPIIIEKIDKRIYYFITAFPKIAIRKFIFLDDWSSNPVWRDTLLEVGFSLVFSLADFYIDEIENEKAKKPIFELLDSFGKNGVKKFINYIETEKEIPEIYIEIFNRDKKTLLDSLI